MKTLAVVLMSSLLSTPAWTQSVGPPALDYVAVADGFKLPPGMTFGGVSGVAIDAKGHIFVLHRGPGPLMEFDADGTFIRALGEASSSGRTACASTRRATSGPPTSPRTWCTR